ncbi:unnamed protein product [Trifolium pratense]|uniref:Uncharacterized protein n=1 Tax=Trifolium pratense TaxID=57577 RepID=A0ACB0JIU6_TRIPR|nr:unnamed protein product [Trifolium pratense]
MNLSFINLSLIFLLFTTSTSVSGKIFSDHISPDFTASYLTGDGNTGTFLVSRNNTFKAAIFNPDKQQTSFFYLCIIHSASNTIIWSANRDAPISNSDIVKLTGEGITIFDKNGNSKWSTPTLKSQVKKLSLTEMGNLVLLDQFNHSLWESFQHPTDTIVIGQRLSVGSSLSSASSSSNFSTGNYNLTITSSDAILQWFGQTYWKLSVDSKAYRISHDDIQYMTVNTTGFYIFGHNETVLVYQLGLSVTNFRIAKLAYNGQFTISSSQLSGESLKQEFVGPNDACQIPLACGRLGLCNDNTLSSSSSSPGCSCPSNFHVASVLLPIAGMILLMVLVFFVMWRKSRKSKKQEVKLGKQISISHSSCELDSDPFSIPGLPMRFDYEELEVATDNFKTLIGSGAFGVVYKGVLPDKTIVAVKKIINIGIQGKKDFLAEIAVIGNIHHVNLVRLKGFCAQRGHRMLVYEYMNRGSLDRNLFGGVGQPVLEWQERLDVALGTARGLAYLHSGCEQKIIHCDIKPENILLHDHFQARISDFGLSKLLSPEQSGLFTTMRGTRGYLAPEWLTNSAISEKTDVYSFGMVLLELISGRKNCSFKSRSHSMDDDHKNSNGNNGNSSNSSTTGLIYFPLYALEMHEQKSYMDLADPRLEGRVTIDEVEKLVRIALCCVHEDPALRPNMVTVVGMLEGGTPLPQPRMESLNFLRFYGRRFSEASVIAEENEHGSAMMQQLRDSTRFVSGFSYMSSQQISGPR